MFPLRGGIRNLGVSTEPIGKRNARIRIGVPEDIISHPLNVATTLGHQIGCSQVVERIHVGQEPETVNVENILPEAFVVEPTPAATDVHFVKGV